MVLPMHATFGEVQFAGRTTSWLVPVVGLCVIGAALAFVSGIGAARILGARLSSFVGLTEVLFAAVFAWLVLGELPVPVQVVGGLFIIGGVVLVRLGESVPGPAVEEAAEEPLVPARVDHASATP